MKSASINFAKSFENVNDGSLSYIPGNKITFLPKDPINTTIAKIIAEPTPNQKIIFPPLPPDDMPGSITLYFGISTTIFLLMI